jgi:hypothetical protein
LKSALSPKILYIIESKAAGLKVPYFLEKIPGVYVKVMAF